MSWGSILLFSHPTNTLKVLPLNTCSFLGPLQNCVRISSSKINQDLIVANKVPPGEKCYNIPSLQSIQSLSPITAVKSWLVGGKEGESLFPHPHCCFQAPARLVKGLQGNMPFIGSGQKQLCYVCKNLGTVIYRAQMHFSPTSHGLRVMQHTKHLPIKNIIAFIPPGIK